MAGKDFLNRIIENIEYSDTHVGINKDDLFALCVEKGFKAPPKKTIKADLIKYLIDHGVSWAEFYIRWKHCTFGIHPTDVEEKFKLNKSQRKKMEQTGFLKVSYTVNTKVFTNTYASVPYYDAEQYFLLTVQEVEDWKVANIRGYKNRKEE